MAAMAPPNDQLDPAWVAEITRRVLARLALHRGPADRAPADHDHPHPKQLITQQTIRQTTTQNLKVAATAIITPAALDEARGRGIVIERLCGPVGSVREPQSATILDSEHPDRGMAVEQQLRRRGIHPGGLTVVLTDHPARDVYEHTGNGQRAAMVTAIGDVERFAAELNPTVWVLDMKRLNLPMAVNAIAKIAHLGAAER